MLVYYIVLKGWHRKLGTLGVPSLCVLCVVRVINATAVWYVSTLIKKSPQEVVATVNNGTGLFDLDPIPLFSYL